LICSVTYNCGFGGSVSKAFAFSMLWISFERNWMIFSRNNLWITDTSMYTDMTLPIIIWSNDIIQYNHKCRYWCPTRTRLIQRVFVLKMKMFALETYTKW
jgi:hypothetical protein